MKSSDFSSTVNWFARIDDRKAPNVKQYLRGLRKYAKHAQLETVRPYNFHLFWIGVVGAYFGRKYLKHNL